MIGGLGAAGLGIACAASDQCLPGLKRAIRAGKQALGPRGEGQFDYIPPPETLVGLPGSVKEKPKGNKSRKRWRLPNGDFVEWDSQHGELELYDKRGKHKGVLDPRSGKQTKPPVPGRRAET
ncbi:colicin E3/pyocin S6 family cytotoxin [Bosea sp. ANAM02]|uniref:colicin E3/pyocin S6 family cytotoxin n=1 Tax=Bosea sp. ANAM02 TaxID=2020412 RepID=UPI001FCEBFE7|nr:colicin E3/pyocin S6 family cytotoxin [Bosea sp. ANAM02]